MKEFKLENGKILQGEVESVRENVGECYYCQEPVYVSYGQLLNYKVVNGQEYPAHKSCRKAVDKSRS